MGRAEVANVVNHFNNYTEQMNDDYPEVDATLRAFEVDGDIRVKGVPPLDEEDKDVVSTVLSKSGFTVKTDEVGVFVVSSE